MFIAMFPGLSPQPLLIEEETMSLSLVKIHENPWMVFLLAIILPQMFRFRKKKRRYNFPVPQGLVLALVPVESPPQEKEGPYLGAIF